MISPHLQTLTRYQRTRRSKSNHLYVADFPFCLMSFRLYVADAFWEKPYKGVFFRGYGGAGVKESATYKRNGFPQVAESATYKRNEIGTGRNGG